jgi:hypothetical protein
MRESVRQSVDIIHPPANGITPISFKSGNGKCRQFSGFLWHNHHSSVMHPVLHKMTDLKQNSNTLPDKE